jgi:predicted metal-dependent hydrolase
MPGEMTTFLSVILLLLQLQKTMNKTIEDKDLGTITFRKKERVRNYTIRISRGEVFVSLPFYGSYKRALEFVEIHRSKLIRKLEESSSKILPITEENELRKKAKAYLPARLDFLAKEYRFDYSTVNIRKSRTRWGSCSSKKTINLSFYLMLLPERLADYVLFHELCHTVYMDQGQEFWQLLENVTGGQAKQLRKELKSYHI